jgi:hypothetical protein
MTGAAPLIGVGGVQHLAELRPARGAAQLDVWLGTLRGASRLRGGGLHEMPRLRSDDQVTWSAHRAVSVLRDRPQASARASRTGSPGAR